MKTMAKKIPVLIIILGFLVSCMSFSTPRESIDENSSGLYGYVEFDEDSKFYGRDFSIAFVREEDENKYFIQIYADTIKDDNSFWLPNLEPGTYRLYTLSYYSNWTRTTYSIYFEENNLFTIKEGEIVYWGAIFSTQEDEIYSIYPHESITRHDVLNNIESELIDNNWGLWLEQARDTLQ